MPSLSSVKVVNFHFHMGFLQEHERLLESTT